MTKEEITFSDFAKLDLRVGKVITAEEVEGSHNLIRMQVDFGDLGKKKIIGGLGKWYKRGQIKDKKFIFVINLTPKQMMKELSSGMMLCADADGKAILLPVNKNIPEGTIIR